MVKQLASMILVMAVLALPLSALVSKAQEGEQETCILPEGESTTIANAYLYIEYNFTDGDIRVHGYFDDHGWVELCVDDPTGKQILHIKPQTQLGDLTMAGIFFESREPELDDYSIEDLLAAFPEGECTVRGTNFDGTGLTGFATFTHNIPAAPLILQPAELHSSCTCVT